MEQLSTETFVYETALEEQTEGYQLVWSWATRRCAPGGEWNFGVFYKYLEADAVLDAFTDSDFHGGGTDAEGLYHQT